MRVLALDWGTVRVGAAISDPEGKFAFPLQQIIAAAGAVDEISKLVAELQVEKILVGLPKGMAGQDTESTSKAEKFIEKVRQKTGLPVETLDERLSSVAAGNALRDQGISNRNQKEIKDNVAAQLMLQQYLDNK
jgi:putative Holliday junction resolvase